MQRQDPGTSRQPTNAFGVAALPECELLRHVSNPIFHKYVMHDWNVIATMNTHRFRSAFKLLEPLGEVRRTQYYNVLSMKVPDIRSF